MICNELVNISKWIESHTVKNENKLKKDLSLTFNNAMKHEGSFNFKDAFLKWIEWNTTRNENTEKSFFVSFQNMIMKWNDWNIFLIVI